MISGSVSTVGGGWRVRLESHGSKIGSDGGPLPLRELDETPGLHDIAGGPLGDTRTVHNRLHSVVGLLRRSVFGRSDGYDDVNDADRPALDPVSRPLFFYIKCAHIGVIPGLDEFIGEYVSEDSFGDGGYLSERGLIPLSGDKRESTRKAATGCQAMSQPS